jgi:Protein of unknown function (DUF2752)
VRSAASIPPLICEPPRPARRSGILIWVFAIACAASLFYFINPEQAAWFPSCWFHRTTGLLCPGCGCSRATHQLLHGNILAAFRLNGLFVSALPFALWQGALALRRAFQHQPVVVPLKPACLWTAAVALVLFGVLRNLPYPVVSWMAGN